MEGIFNNEEISDIKQLTRIQSEELLKKLMYAREFFDKTSGGNPEFHLDFNSKEKYSANNSIQ